MKRFILYILTLFLFFTNTQVFAANFVKKEIKVQSVDKFNIVGTLSYPKLKGQKEFKTVILLHSLGYDSFWWENLPQDLLDNGYAVLTIDLRGHGKSVYNSKLVKMSWKDMRPSAYQKMPEDVLEVINFIKEESPKRSFFKNYVIVGADIGSSVGILVADKMNEKPATIVMLSPVVNVKGLYIPVKMAQLNDTDFLSILGINELTSQKDSKYLKRFAQANYTEYVSKSNSTGMMLLKNDEDISKIIVRWVNQYLNK